jgi:hypothetical protein
MTRRAWLFVVLGFLACIIIDRVYVFNLAPYAVHEKSHRNYESNHDKKHTNSPFLALIIEGEEFIDTHEKLFIVLSTFAIAIFTATLYRATNGLFKMAENQGIDMKRSLDLAEKQMALAGLQADLAERQHGLQRWQYLTTHRPKLIIRRISLDEGTPITTPISRPWKIQFIIANVGGSRATITESNATFLEIGGEDLPAIPPFSNETDTIKTLIREAGQSDPPECLYLDEETVKKLIFRQMQVASAWEGNGESLFYFFGYIQYRDGVEIERRMAFCRRYNLITKRFSKIDDPDYEYAD